MPKNNKPSRPLITPCVHLNGTGRAALAAQREAAHTAGTAFLEALAAARPHGRDFYPLGDSAYREADKIQQAREKQVTDILDDLIAEYRNIEKAGT